jgi:acetyl-CoA acetyltransferase
MNIAGLFGRRNLLKAAAVLGGLSTLSARTASGYTDAENDNSGVQDRSDEARMAAIRLGATAKVTVERRGQIVLIGINRPYIQNRVDPEYGVAAVEPGLFGLGPVPVVCKALERAGRKLSDVERIEINEAFAAVPLAVAQELGLPEDIINVEGGAIAHGHPIGATGAVLAARLLHAMRRDGIRRGLVTLCIGGGRGIAVALEAA